MIVDTIEIRPIKLDEWLPYRCLNGAEPFAPNSNLPDTGCPSLNYFKRNNRETLKQLYALTISKYDGYGFVAWDNGKIIAYHNFFPKEIANQIKFYGYGFDSIQTDKTLIHNCLTIHQLVIIGSFIYDFLCIHPFQDGNGRLSRLLTTLCLLQNNYSFIQYISFENHIEQNKKAYYEALMNGQRNRGTDSERIDLWLIFFLESLKTLTEKLERKYDVFKFKGGYLNDRQKQIKDFISNNQPIKVSDLAKQFPEIGLSTLKKDLRYLRDEQVLTMIGKGKGSVYVLTEKK